MHRFFFEFPRGWPGVALLFMRAIIGVAILLQGESYLREPDAGPAAGAVGMAAILAGGLLLIGFLTPFVCSAVLFGALGVVDLNPSMVFPFTILLAIIALGPGALSVDARIFGRREIIFPRSVPRP